MSQTKGERGAAEKAEGMDTQRALLSLVAIFLVSFSALAFVYTNFPQMDPEEYQYIKLPTDIEDAKNLGRVLSHYKNRYYLEVLAGVFVTYIFLQTFAIPGSIFLSILSGFLFRWEIALLLICFCSATGASFCYLLSYLAGRPAVLKYMPERTKSWQEKVDKQRDNLLFYIIFLRITPFLPNWFINITSPVINVPLMPFWFGTFLGVAPPSILAVQAGTTLYELTSSRDAFSLTSVLNALSMTRIDQTVKTTCLPASLTMMHCQYSATLLTPKTAESPSPVLARVPSIAMTSSLQFILLGGPALSDHISPISMLEILAFRPPF